MSTVRLRRLTADSTKLHDYVRRHPRVRLIQVSGDPPERYQFEYRIKSLRMVGSDLQVVQSHVVEIALPLSYPRMPPQCRMLSPVFHPNIAPHAICVGDHWGAGESLESIVIRIGEMLAYQSYNVKSPLNGEAARWVEENKHRLPLDPVSLLPEEEKTEAANQVPVSNGSPVGLTVAPTKPELQPQRDKVNVDLSPSTPTPSTPAAPSNNTTTASQIVATCSACGARYRVSSTLTGRTVRCNKCGQSFRCASDEPTSPSLGGNGS